MDVASFCPLRVGAVFWQPHAGVWVLTVACKATYRLVPGTAELHSLQEEPNEDDRYWDDDPTRSPYAACDLVPLKPAADVLLVGHAFSGGHAPVRSLVARLSIGGLDKSIELWCQRRWNTRGELIEGRPFTKRPLRYERAAGGPGTSNPVGIPPDALADEYGLVPLPDLLPVGFVPRHRAAAPAVGFGPIAPTWPDRAGKLGEHAATFGPGAWRTRPLPAGLDASYFQAAPEDQRLTSLQGSELIVLEHLHPIHARLHTRLPGLRPRVTMERGPGVEHNLGAVADTLWIDTDRALATLVWRAQAPVGHPLEAGKVTVKMERPDGQLMDSGSQRQYVQASDLARDWNMAAAIAPRPAEARMTSPLPHPRSPRQAHSHGTQKARPDETLAIQGSPDRATLPFRAPLGGDEPPPRSVAPDSGLPFQKPAPAAKPMMVEKPPILEAPPPMPAPAAPSPTASPWATGTPPPVLPSRPLSLGDTPPGIGEPRPSASLSMGEQIVSVPASPPPLPAPQVGIGPDRAGRRRMGEPPLGVAQHERSALGFSNAAADLWDGDSPGLQPPAATPEPQAAIELLWFDAVVASRIRKPPLWKKLLASRKPKARDEDEADADADKRQQARDRHDVLVILKGGTVTDDAGIPRAMAFAVDDAVFVPPLVLVAGELEFPFDEVETLKATLAAVSPFAATDKKLKETVDMVNELLQTSWIQGASTVAEGLSAQVKEAFAEQRRALPEGYIEATTERMLLTQRRYQKRMLFGQEQIRGLFRMAPDGEGIPTYLPGDLANELPMFRVMRVRMMAEARFRVDQGERAEVALKALALGHVTLPR